MAPWPSRRARSNPRKGSASSPASGASTSSRRSGRTGSSCINQSGTRLTGHATDEFGEYEINGRVVDDQVTVTWSVAEDGKMLEITMKGKLESATLITGTAKLGDVGEGPLSARRTGDAGDH